MFIHRLWVGQINAIWSMRPVAGLTGVRGRTLPG